MALRPAGGSAQWARAALDFSACAGSHLLLGFLLAAVPDRRTDRAAWHTAGKAVPGRGAEWGGAAQVLVRAHAVLALIRAAHDDGRGVGGAHRVGCGIAECVAASQLLRLFCVLPLVCNRCRCVLELSVRRHVVGGWLSGAVLRAERIAAGLGKRKPAGESRFDSAAMGVVPHLL